MAAEKERDPGSSSAEIGKYLDILAKDPNSRVFAPLAEAYRKAGLFDDAVEIALEGLKVHPNYLGGRVALGRAYFEKKQYAEAAAEMQKVAKSAPDNIIAHKVLGQIAYQTERSARRREVLQDGSAAGSPGPGGAAVHREPCRDGHGGAGAGQPAPAATAAATAAATGRRHSRRRRAGVAAGHRAAPAAAAGAAAVPRPCPPPAPAPLPFDEIQAIEDIDLQADDIFGGQPPAPDGGMELEVFSRELWKGDSERAASPPPAPAPGQPAPACRRRPLPRQSRRIRRSRSSPAIEVSRPLRRRPELERGGETGPRELDIETTAYNPPDMFIPEGCRCPAVESG